jgi:RNA polymerase sigma-70 factor, ECF subfamily
VVGVGPAQLNGAARRGSVKSATELASDETLAAQAVALGDPIAFEALVRRHERRIHYILLRLTRNPALAEELCQETFLIAWRKLSGFEGRGSFAGWLARVAHNVFLAQHRLARTGAEIPLDDPEAAVDARTGTEISDEAPDLDRLLAVVSAEEQQVLILSYAAGLSATEIGEMLGLSAGTVKSQIHRAKLKIREHFAIGGG